jgi:hypothetical protein
MIRYLFALFCLFAVHCAGPPTLTSTTTQASTFCPAFPPLRCFANTGDELENERCTQQCGDEAYCPEVSDLEANACEFRCRLQGLVGVFLQVCGQACLDAIQHNCTLGAPP